MALLKKENVKYIVVHCSATKNSIISIGRDEIDLWHKKRGWGVWTDKGKISIGYHFVVRRVPNGGGMVEQGRPLKYRGAHVRKLNSVSVGDVDGYSGYEIVTAGSYFDGVRMNSQLVVWDGSTLDVVDFTGWYWTSDTFIDSVDFGDVDGDFETEIICGGRYFDSHENAQLTIWGMN